jgi:hypothetical protein
VQGTAEFHHQIADACLPQADAVFDDTATLDTTVDMLNPEPTLVERLVGPVLRQRSLLTTGLPGRHEDLSLRQREGQEAQVLSQPALCGQGRGRRVSNALIMDTAAVGIAQKEDQEEGIDSQDIFDGVVLVLATITFRLCRSVLGADDPPFRPVMGTRGASGAAAPGDAISGMGSSSSGATMVAASVSETPRR